MAPQTRDIVQEAQEILRGRSATTKEMLELSRLLKREREFGYARRVLARARHSAGLGAEPELRLKIYQQSALCTYKDPDLPVDRRLDRALEILREIEDLAQTRNQETLGLAGAIYKRKWEVDSQKPQLERSLFYYLRGHAEGAAHDQGYAGINAAYILDLLAHQEEGEADGARIPAGSPERARIEERRALAAHIREEIAEKVAPLIDRPETNWLQGKWWFYSTLAEAHFGLGGRGDEAHYDVAVSYLERGRREANPPEWEFESTARQLASLARLQARTGATAADLEGTAAWDALTRFLGRPAPVRSAFYGRIGLGLSGGGFRASLFHIGVLARLAELDVLRRVEVISCVSGGSIIGAHYYLEVRKLLQEKADEEITREDYIELVRRVERDFLKGVQRNVRTRVASEPWTNLKMIFGSDSAPLRWFFGPAYSRTMRAGELFESEIFSRVEDGGGGASRYLSQLYVRPKGEPEDFRPKQGNWQREAKVPVLILNATTLNTGHGWHFTASYMGEPPAGIDSQIDGNDRLRRLYYTEAPERWRQVRLGHAVAASACVPGLFEPIALDGLYPGRVVRLVDGGVCDNQGVAGLVEQDCNVILISDGSGQMESLKDPSRGLLGVPLRSSSVLQARVRQSQFQDLSARLRSHLLRGFMFVHLKEDLDVDPVDWIDCLDPSDADDDDSRPAARRGSLTGYGVAKELQQSLASVRTDLDSFSDVEAHALMTSAYLMTKRAFAEKNCVEGFDSSAPTEPWDFLAVEGGMKGVGPQYRYVKRLLDVSGALAFKIWKLRRGLQYVAYALAAFAFVGGVWAAWTFRDSVILKAISVGAVSMFVVGFALTALATALIGKRLMRVVRLRETLIRAGVWFAVGFIGSFAAWLHLHFFDPMFLREGSADNYRKRFDLGHPAPLDARAAAPAPEPAPAATLAADTPPPQAAPAAPEVVGAGVEILPHATAEVSGNGHAAEPDAFAERIEIKDPEERQD